MDALMLEGWTPILLIGLGFAVLFIIFSRSISRKSLYSVAVISGLICIAVVIYSLIGIGGWDGVGVLFLTVTVFFGIWIGTIVGDVLIKEN